MAAIILTWDDEENARIVTDESEKNIVFGSIENADSWREDNSGELDGYSRIVDLDD